MTRVHFFTVTEPLDTLECAELGKVIEQALAEKGFVDDRAVVMYAVEYKGTVVDDG